MTCLPAASALAETRDVLVCTTSNAPAELKKAAADFVAHAETAPLVKALRSGGDYESVKTQNSEGLLEPKAYDRAAHNHLIVIGLPSQDPLMDKVWGFNVSVDPKNRSLYSEGWGNLQGDLGWIECDRNPFLHSHRIKSAPEGTILVKISGTSIPGVLAALHAFQGGLLGGFVPVGHFQRLKTTLLDRNPDPAPPPVALPPTVTLRDGKTGMLAGWYDVPESEYRAVEEASGIAPVRMWRCKYLAPHIMEEKSIVRWLGGVHRMAFGNAGDIIEFASAGQAQQAVEQMARHDKFKKVGSQQNLWMVPQATDEVIDQAYWNIYLTSSAKCVVLSTLTEEGTGALAKSLATMPTR